MSIGTALFFLEISGYSVQPLHPYTWQVSKEDFKAVVGEHRLNLLAEACDTTSDLYQKAAQDVENFDDAVVSKIESLENEIQDLQDEIARLEHKIMKLENRSEKQTTKLAIQPHELVFGKVSA